MHTIVYLECMCGEINYIIIIIRLNLGSSHQLSVSHHVMDCASKLRKEQALKRSATKNKVHETAVAS